MLDLNRELSQKRAEELKKQAIIDIKGKEEVAFGMQSSSIINNNKNKIKILEVLGATEEDWNNPEWQMENRITNIETLLEIYNFSKKELEEIRKVNKTYRFAITPYYLSLIDFANSNCPIKRQCFPNISELDDFGELDPMSEKTTNPVGTVTRRYPNKLIINITNACPAYCRHCQRRRLIGEKDLETSNELIEESIQYVRDNKEIREVLITGGDALTVNNEKLEYIFGSLRKIEHVEILRLGTRALVTMPQRIDKELAVMLRKYKVFVATHFNHALELTPDAIRAVDILTDHGVQVRNQMVLLKGVNDNKYIMQKTNEELVKSRIIPYYLFHPKQVKGTKHFQVSIEEGLEIMKHLEGHTSGMCKPTYVLNAKGGAGKVPLFPTQNLIKIQKGYRLTTWENREVILES